MPRGENRPSILLSREENDTVFGLIGPKCQSLATAVVQLFITEGPAHSEWKKKDTGVLCLIKDNGRRSYFFRIYCLYRKCMIWEHEVYMQIEYKSPRPYLHTFEAEEYMTAFNFANEDEARILRNILIEKIELRKARREERRQRSMLATRTNSGALQNYQNGVAPAPQPAPQPAPAYVPPLNETKTNLTSGYSMRTLGKKPKTRKLTKADIGMPQIESFKHVHHVGLNSDNTFEVENLKKEELEKFFSIAGVSEVQLQDQETREFIYDFINQNGGPDRVKEEIVKTLPNKSSRPPAALPPAPPPAPRPPARAPAPAPPSRAPPPPPARAVPPPPPPPVVAPAKNPPPPRPSQPPPSVPPPPPPTAPPPPPPPPAPGAPPPPPAMPAEVAAPAAADPRAALMESIKNANKTLRHVDVDVKIDGSRSNLLSEIQQGVQLRPVSTKESKPMIERDDSPGGLAGALKRALDLRNQACHSSDSELSDNTSDGEWNDDADTIP